MQPEHRAKISHALREYCASERSHIKRYQRSGPDHPNFRGGIQPKYYRRVAFAHYGEKCQRCNRGPDGDGTDAYLVVHHRDENRRRSDLANLEPLCMSCHLRHHRSARA